MKDALITASVMILSLVATAISFGVIAFALRIGWELAGRIA